jgi:REP element-mobilizing transposase RayT
MKRVRGASELRRLTVGFHHRDHLPHLKREGGTYFVTFRLAGSLPADEVERLKRERELLVQQAFEAKRPLTWHEQEELFRWYSTRVDNYLDAGHGDCFLRQPKIAGLVAGAIQHFAGQRYELRAWVVMPNHVHAALRPQAGYTLSQILKSWKGYSASEANRFLDREGKFWQTEFYDHLIRDDVDLQRCCHYTIMNPVNARLCEHPEDWPWSSAYRPPS